MSGLRVVGRRLDWVQFSANPVQGGGNLREDVVASLEGMRAAALDHGAAAPFPVPASHGVPGGALGGVTHLFPDDVLGPYRVCLENWPTTVRITRSPILPSLLVDHFGAAPIDTDFGSRLDARPVCDRFLDGGYSTAVAGCEVAIDYQYPGLNAPLREHIVTRSRKHLASGFGTGLYGSPAGGLQWIISDVPAAFEDEQIRDGWEASGGYRRGLPVYRLQVRFFGPVLRAMRVQGKGPGIRTLEELYESMGDLLGVALGDERHRPWFGVIDASAGAGPRYSERATAGWWAGLREAALEGLPSSARRRTNAEAYLEDRKAASFGRLLTSAVKRIARHAGRGFGGPSSLKSLGKGVKGGRMR